MKAFNFAATKYAASLYAGMRNLLKARNVRVPCQCYFSSASSDSSSQQQPTSQNLYDILGVEKTASVKEIKAAYYELSKKYHPDAAGSKESADGRRFHQITEAYDTLGNEEKRRAYDEQTRKSYYANGAGSGGEYRDADLEMLRELQRKWNLRRHYARNQQRAQSDFEMKHDKEEFEAFYRRYRENMAKAQKWDESVGRSSSYPPSREQYTEFQKEYLRRQHQKQMDNAASGSVFLGVLVLTLLLLFLVGAF